MGNVEDMGRLQVTDSQQDQQAEDHRKGVVIQVAGLYVSNFKGTPADGLAHPVHDQSVNQQAIPERIAYGAHLSGARGKQFLIQLIESVLVQQHAVQYAQFLLAEFRQLRLAHIHPPGR